MVNEVPDLPIGRLPVRTPEELDAVITKSAAVCQTVVHAYRRCQC